MSGLPMLTQTSLSPSRWTFLRPDALALSAVIALSFFVFGKISHWITIESGTLNAVFYFHALALPGFLIYGFRIWPGILLGQFLLVANTGMPLESALLYSLNHTIQAATGAWLLRHAGFELSLTRMRDYLWLLAILAFLVQPLGALMTAATLRHYEIIEWDEFGATVFQQWLNSLMAAVIMTPALLALLRLTRRDAPTQRLWQLLATLSSATLVLVLILISPFGREIQALHFFALAHLFLMGITLAWGMIGASLAALLITAIVQVYSFSGFGPFSLIADAEERVLYINSFILAIAITAQLVGVLISQNARQQRALIEQAHTDALTGLYNRRYFYETMKLEWASLRRHHRDVALLWMDIDHFKRINDTHGHAAGDAALQDLAALLRKIFRLQDVKARVGGEEFGVLLRDCHDLPQAAEKLLAAVRERADSAAAEVSFRISIGATRMLADDVSIEAVMQRADNALYRAKHGGRDRVEFAPTPSAP
jgi:diguanylate cyclase (GGDEF)-like protein